MSVFYEYHCGFAFRREGDSRVWAEVVGSTRTGLVITDLDFGCQVALMVDGEKVAKAYAGEHDEGVQRCLREIAEVADNLRRYASKT